MRGRTRNLLLGIAAIVVLLLALGFLPTYLASGDPYYVSATSLGPVTDAGNGTGADSQTNATNGSTAPPSVNGSALPARRFPYTTDALERASTAEPGRSEPYWRGYVGLKEAFTHSPFDELDAIRSRNPNARLTDGAVRVAYNATWYRVVVTQEGGS